MRRLKVGDHVMYVGVTAAISNKCGYITKIASYGINVIIDGEVWTTPLYTLVLSKEGRFKALMNEYKAHMLERAESKSSNNQQETK